MQAVLWLMKRRDSAFVDHHGKQALNYQLTLTVAYVLVAVAGIVIGVLYGTDTVSPTAALICGLAWGGVVFVLIVYELIVVMLASVASMRGRHFRILGNIPFVR